QALRKKTSETAGPNTGMGHPTGTLRGNPDIEIPIQSEVTICDIYDKFMTTNELRVVSKKFYRR
ncbi:MAG: hypothetical protein ACREXG_07130, partial [Polaromonas sp.]